jgi:drug/metabolite transporter (DMT)-like permease
LFSLPAAFTESSVYMPTEINGWLNLIALAVLCQVGGQYFITIGMPKVKASFAAIGLLMQPITATILGALIMMEWLTIFQSMFGVLALTGIYLARLELTNGSKN